VAIIIGISAMAIVGCKEKESVVATDMGIETVKDKENVMVFLAVRFAVAEEKAIGCMGNLIQKNATENGSAYYAGEGFQKMPMIRQI